jgi:hypothetical protein
MVLTLNPLSRAFGLSGSWKRGEDFLRAKSASSAAAHFIEELRVAVGIDVE